MTTSVIKAILLFLYLISSALSLPAETSASEYAVENDAKNFNDQSDSSFQHDGESTTTEEPLIVHSVKKKDGVLEETQVTPDTTAAPEVIHSLEDILTSILTSKNGSISLSDLEDPDVKASIALLAEDINSLFEADQMQSTYYSDDYYRGEEYVLPSMYSESPKLQFLEPDLGPAVLPLKVPEGYFVPFIPRQAFGVANGVSRPSHGHASFYKHRPSGLVDVKNSPAFGYLLAGP